jgi:hypothetical protein
VLSFRPDDFAKNGQFEQSDLLRPEDRIRSELLLMQHQYIKR